MDCLLFLVCAFCKIQERKTLKQHMHNSQNVLYFNSSECFTKQPDRES